MRSKAWLAASVWLRLARLPPPASRVRRSRRLRDTLAAAPGLLAHACVTEAVKYSPMGPKLRKTTVLCFTTNGNQLGGTTYERRLRGGRLHGAAEQSSQSRILIRSETAIPFPRWDRVTGIDNVHEPLLTRGRGRERKALALYKQLDRTVTGLRQINLFRQQSTRLGNRASTISKQKQRKRVKDPSDKSLLLL